MCCFVTVNGIGTTPGGKISRSSVQTYIKSLFSDVLSEVSKFGCNASLRRPCETLYSMCVRKLTRVSLMYGELSSKPTAMSNPQLHVRSSRCSAKL